MVAKPAARAEEEVLGAEAPGAGVRAESPELRAHSRRRSLALSSLPLSLSLSSAAAEPRAPLWSYVVASQLVDWGWSGLVMAGVERLRLDPSLPGSHLVLEYMPWTHSLPGALVWAVGGALAAKAVLRVPWAAAAMLGAVVFSPICLLTACHSLCCVFVSFPIFCHSVAVLPTQRSRCPTQDVVSESTAFAVC